MHCRSQRRAARQSASCAGYRRQSGKNRQQPARGKRQAAGRRAACNEPVNACIREWMPLLASSHARAKLKWLKKIHSSRGRGEGGGRQGGEAASSRGAAWQCNCTSLISRKKQAEKNRDSLCKRACYANCRTDTHKQACSAYDIPCKSCSFTFHCFR